MILIHILYTKKAIILGATVKAPIELINCNTINFSDFAIAPFTFLF
jgi:hypothetical protein